MHAQWRVPLQGCSRLGTKLAIAERQHHRLKTTLRTLSLRLCDFATTTTYLPTHLTTHAQYLRPSTYPSFPTPAQKCALRDILPTTICNYANDTGLASALASA